MKSQKISNNAFEEWMESSNSNPQASYERGEKFLSNSIRVSDKYGIAKSQLLLAYSGQFLGLHAQSFEYINTALPVFIEFKDLKSQASSYNTLGFIYYYFDDHENRLDVNLKSLEISKEINDENGIIRSLNNTGDTYLELEKYHQALELFHESLSLCVQNKRLKAIIMSNIAEAYLFIKKHDQALSFVDDSIIFAKDLKMYNLVFENYSIKSHIYNNLKNWKSSIEQLELASILINSNIIFDEYSLKRLYKSASIAYEQSNDYKLSLKYLKKHFELVKNFKENQQKKEIKSIQFKKEISQLKHKTSQLELTIHERTKELEQALEAEKHVSYFTQELTNTNNLDEVLWKLVKSCISKLDLEDCVVYLLDDEEGVLVQKAAYGPKSPSDEQIESPITIRLGDGIVGSVAKYGKHEMINDTSKDMRYIVDDDIRYSELAVPIFYENKVIGVIDSEHSEKNFFNKRHISLFRMLASLVQSRIGKLKEQEEKQILQEKIIKINNSLEKKIKVKSKENTQLNHKILEQEKKAIIGEMSAIITHELNTPLATIKGGNEAILFLFNKILNSNFIELINKDEMDFIINKTDVFTRRVKSEKEAPKNQSLNSSDFKKLGLKTENKNLIKSIKKSKIIETTDIDKLVEFKNTEFILDILNDIDTIINFNDVILKSVGRATNVVDDLKSLAEYDENPEKRKILLLNNFEGLQVHISLSHPEAKFEFDLNTTHYIFGNEFRTIQLWSNIIHLIIDNCKFKKHPEFIIKSIKNDSNTSITISCKPSSIITEMFNKDILNNRFLDDIEGSEKLKLNIIQNILIEHRAKLKCSNNDELLRFEILF